MDPATARTLDNRAQLIGDRLGLRLRFRVAPDGLFAGLTAGSSLAEAPVANFVGFGPAAAHAAHWDLDRLEDGRYVIHEAPAGAVLVRFLSAAELIAKAEGRGPR
ncbi:hypothetical protein [Pimelobacter simplex]|uniref:hypothetical protein n=1 Tax=Nocardioides simplex TaxID=2045 RepID=UPI00214F7F98|nr:hypothetical protein [Pimelobacter simplex]UUW92865.1 hypothetical protein M0M43_30205 [Pimelobacter simplex]UUW98898.1 hypothetical protein M0M48_30225 [Pimelobacter simplex]